MVTIEQAIPGTCKEQAASLEPPTILGHFEFESEGSPLSMTFWQGNNTLQLLTNFIGVYPFNSLNIPAGLAGYQAERLGLEAYFLKESGLGFAKSLKPEVHGKEYYSETLNNGVVRFCFDKAEFSRLPEEVRRKFLTKYRQLFLWQTGFLRKAELDGWLKSVLAEKNSIDTLFKQSHDAMLVQNSKGRQSQLLQAFNLVNSNYNSAEFETQLISCFFKEIGYLASPGIITKAVSIFNETHYSPSTAIELKESLAKIASKLKLDDLVCQALNPEPEKEGEELKKKFSQRLFETCKIALEGENPFALGSRAYDYIPKQEQLVLIDRLKEFLSARRIYIRNSEYSADIKYQLGELLQAVRDRNAISMTRKDIKRLLAGRQPVGTYSNEILENIMLVKSKAQALEDKILADDLRNSLTLDYGKRRALLYLELMSRDQDCKPKFRHLTFTSLANADEMLGLPIAFYDIEKFQFGSIKEKVDGCATIVKLGDTISEAQLDFLKPVPASQIQGFNVKSHEYSRNLVKSIGDLITRTGSFMMMSFGSYDPKQLSKTREFFAGTQERKLIPRERVHVSFIERYEGVGSAVNLLTLMKIIFPHFQNTKLATVINYLGKKSGGQSDFSKAFSHEELRTADRSAEKLFRQGDASSVERALSITEKLAFYTVDDVKKLTGPLFSTHNRWLWEDLLEACRTFQVTIDQASSSYNFSNHLISRNYFERFGTFLNKEFLYNDYLDAKKSFMQSYQEERISGLERNGASFTFEKGLASGIDMLYYSPEMQLSPILFEALPQLEDYVDKTLEIDDPERQVARLQLMKPLIISALSQSRMLGKWQEKICLKKARLQQINDEIAGKSLLTQDPEHSRGSASDSLTLGLKKEKYAATKKIRESENLLNAERTSFKRQFGIMPEELSQATELAYKIAADGVRIAGLKPVQAKGSFIFAAGGTDNALLAAAGLFKVRSGLTIFSMGNGILTYKSQGTYAGFPTKFNSPNNRYSMLELYTIKSVLDCIFGKDFDGAFCCAQKSYEELLTLHYKLAMPQSSESTGFFRRLQTFNRRINRYVGVVGKAVAQKNNSIGEAYVREKYTPDQRSSFKPLEEYYLGPFAARFYGISPYSNAVEVNAVLPTIFGGLLRFGDGKKPVSEDENKARTAYAKLFSSRKAVLEEFILT